MITITQPEEVIANRVTELHEEIISEWIGIKCMKSKKIHTRNSDAFDALKNYIIVGSKSVIKKAAKIVMLLDLKVEHMTDEEVSYLSESYNDEYAKKFVNEQFVFEAFYTGHEILNLKEVYDCATPKTSNDSVGDKSSFEAMLESAASAE